MSNHSDWNTFDEKQQSERLTEAQKEHLDEIVTLITIPGLALIIIIFQAI